MTPVDLATRALDAAACCTTVEVIPDRDRFAVRVGGEYGIRIARGCLHRCESIAAELRGNPVAVEEILARSRGWLALRPGWSEGVTP